MNVKKILKTSMVAAIAALSLNAGDLTIATVNNGHMVEMQKLSKVFEKQNPDVKLKWVVLEEGVLRQRVTTDIATKGGQFDIMTIGMYEAPMWGKKGWIEEMKFDAAYDEKDLLPAMVDGLSNDGKLYAAPFYGESSMLMYRKDLVQKAGMTITDNPSWEHIEKVAKAINNPEEGIYGICLRGKAGWGDNMALITTMANTFGAQWFDKDGKPQLDSKEWNSAINYYVNLVSKYGPPGSSGNSFNEILALFNEGKCGMWIDATIAASFISDPKQSKVHDKIAFAQSPVGVTSKGANWLWSWALAIPSSTKNLTDAQKFISWATSKEYIELVGKTNGWGKVPTGTRKSTYENQNFKDAAVFADAELKAILSANPKDSTLNPTPFVGVQFVTIPEFQGIATTVGKHMSSALAGKVSVEKALKSSQKAADRTMKRARYYK
ncbi:sugar ABC transporter substrate-binding protein [Poseidonibacter parvus]|uniref:Sugar ABC transporter substrate-binding protein n=1 Tax=Poseidonibacter parvus TaxID=1850254 RepID=A0A1P8KM75_9BACT|nr:sugar ABC transporter substrate-binding protein [Poseidonibacter parvus]APW65651.1 sugar ABC transporter substrate-binding protein [Poseidonibacter parvus]